MCKIDNTQVAVFIFTLIIWSGTTLSDNNQPESEFSHQQKPGISDELMKLPENLSALSINELDLLSQEKERFSDEQYVRFLLALHPNVSHLTKYRFIRSVGMISNLMPLPLSASSYFYLVLRDLMININSDWTIYHNYNLIVTRLYPFQRDTTGVAIYKNSSRSNRDRIRSISRHDSEEDIITPELEVASFIPYEYSEKITNGLSNEERKNFTIIMVFILDAEFKNLWQLGGDIKHFVGIMYQGLCKYDYVPMVKAFFKTHPNSYKEGWTTFGNNTVNPFKFTSRSCQPSEFIFFGNLRTEEASDFGFTDTVPVACSKLPTPKSACLTQNFQLTDVYCYSNVSLYTGKETYNSCYDGHIAFSGTQGFQEIFTNCSNSYEYGFCNNGANFIVENALTADDMTICFKLCTRILSELQQKSDTYDYKNKTPNYVIPNDVSNLIHEALIKSVAIQHKNPTQLLLFYNSTLDVIYNTLMHFEDNLYVYPDMVHQKTSATSHIVGFVLYKSNNSLIYTANPLTAINASTNYSSDSRVRAIVYRDGVNITDADYKSFHLFTFDRGITLDEDCICKSMTLVFLNKHIRESINYTVYLRMFESKTESATGSYINNSYLATIEVQPSVITALCISEPNTSIRDPAKKLTMLQHFVEMDGSNVARLRNKTVKRIDIFSNLKIFVNKDIDNDQIRYAAPLKILTVFFSILSIIGTICVFTSAILMKDWYKERLCSIQLTIAVTCETILFLFNDNYITRAGYIFFYYSLLSELTWLSIIGYVRYMKDTNVFENPASSTCKISLIGWVSPAIITLIAILSHLDCITCNFCGKDYFGDVFWHFTLIPISAIMACIWVIYVCIFRIAQCMEMFSDETFTVPKRGKVLMVNIILAVSWLCIAVFCVPSIKIPVSVRDVFRIIISLQGFIIFVVVVLLDKNTRNEWAMKLKLVRTLHITDPPQ